MKLTIHTLCLAMGLAASAARADLTYTQNFDSMGQSGTAAPAGWSFSSLSGSHDLFSYAGSSASITTTFLPSSTPTAINNGTGSSTLTANATLLAVTGPTNQRAAQGYNFGLSASPTDRALGTSPTGNAASELELSLINNDGGSLNSVTISYDIRRFSTTTTNNSGYTGPAVGLEENPGYWLFYSLDNGATWANVSALNPTIAGPSGVIVPNSVGVTNVPATTFSLSGAWNLGSTLKFRWVDDNAQSPSPDQLIALDNVSITAVPTPGSLSLLGVGALTMSRRRRAR